MKYTSNQNLHQNSRIKRHSSSVGDVSVVFVPKDKGMGVQERIQNIPKVLYNNQWTITRKGYFANTKSRCSPSAKELPPPPSSWISSASTEDISSTGYDSDDSSMSEGSLSYAQDLGHQMQDIAHEKSANWKCDNPGRTSSMSSGSSSSSSEMEEAMLYLPRSLIGIPQAAKSCQNIPVDSMPLPNYPRYRSSSANM